MGRTKHEMVIKYVVMYYFVIGPHEMPPMIR